MASNTDPRLQKQVIYSVYVRSHTPEGTFRAVIPDLDRIKALGTDIIWFLPIHPIGVKGKKGSLGCPYANRDYRSVNPAYGTLEDFRILVDEIHRRGMKVMIDVVYNHTSPDALLFEQHPEYYYRDAQGRPGNKFGDWADVIDLDYRVKELWDYQIESLRYWAGIVDGFRCDVASLVPLDLHRSFASLARRQGFHAAGDTEAYDAFDLEYDYDIREVFDKVLRRQAPLSQWLDLLDYQEAVYPANYNKMRCLENHDQPRIASVIPDEAALVNYTALLYFLRGTVLLYAGQEFEDPHLPSLFEKEPIDRHTGRDLSPLLRRLWEIRQTEFQEEDSFRWQADDEQRLCLLRRDKCAGLFSLDARPGALTLDPGLEIPDGCYPDLLGGGEVLVEGGRIQSTGKPIIFSLP